MSKAHNRVSQLAGYLLLTYTTTPKAMTHTNIQTRPDEQANTNTYTGTHTHTHTQHTHARTHTQHLHSPHPHARHAQPHYWAHRRSRPWRQPMRSRSTWFLRHGRTDAPPRAAPLHTATFRCPQRSAASLVSRGSTVCGGQGPMCRWRHVA